MLSTKQNKTEILKKINKKEASLINDRCQSLQKWQETPDKQEDEDKIPKMKKSEIVKINNYPEWIK